VRIRDGRLTEELKYPVTWNVGKRERMAEIAAEIEQEPGGKKVFILAGFGDSYSTDGPFLKCIASQSLPAGEPIAVFYGEGAAPEEYAGVFYHARHVATVSSSPLPHPGAQAGIVRVGFSTPGQPENAVSARRHRRVTPAAIGSR
jgi:hypothetical protein